MTAGRWGPQVCLDCAEVERGYCETCTVARAMLANNTAPLEAAIVALQAELDRRNEARLFGHAQRLRKAARK